MTTGSLTASRVFDEFRKCGITHIVWLPDSEARFMYEAMMDQQEITLIPVCREGEAIAIAAGLVLGGKRPVVLHQNSGLFESGDSVASLALDLKIPLLLLIGYRGWRRNMPMTDCAGILLEPTLDAWSIKHYLMVTDEDVEYISTAYREAQETSKPVAVLIAREYR
ncbi:MAG: thiamine pyrophosphate-binding protein [Dehalococcoidales bacterium]|nr:thiamine pyrophosphate-binding protein [Dehalococcoidales bacterium]